MLSSEAISKARVARAASIVANFLLSWTILPFLVPPFSGYSLGDLAEVLLWQAMGMVGWPLALFGGVLSLVMQPQSTDLGSLLLLLVYPAIGLLLVLVLVPKRPNGWVVIALHTLLALSFAAVWHGVLTGYDFMRG
jgi:hypothetical protein